ncbi:hypothetical protein MVEN_01279500 [Mycena venus]|uniref:Uncharacterized protein n=1 Tax=Mycena venus TaxID=2733690 RepID=A0A8H7CTH3_9AGAR|nr:hypothetical protein MVEN_01279500 [Mycena venus]
METGCCQWSFFQYLKVRLLLRLHTYIHCIPASKKHRKKAAYQHFVRQMYHACLARVFEPLKAAMTTPEVVRCADGHFRRVIYGLGPYIADYPEQVWLSCIVQNWCPKCDPKPDNLDAPNARRRKDAKTAFLVTCFDPGTLWDDFGIRSDVIVDIEHVLHI